MNDTETCGKRCTCNFHYSSTDNPVNIGSMTYGMCYDAASNDSYCGVNEATCGDGEVFIGPHDEVLAEIEDCTCDVTTVGACMESSETFSHCAVTSDSCLQGQTFIRAKTLMVDETKNIDCMLCKNTWDPTASPTKSPTLSPTAKPTPKPTSSPIKAPTVTPTVTAAGALGHSIGSRGFAIVSLIACAVIGV